MSKIVVIGGGYVGLVSAACFASKNHDVTVVEIDPNKLAQLRNGEVPFYEPGLPELVSRVHAHSALSYTESIKLALADKPEFIFLCVGTPSAADGSVDMSYVHQVAHEVGQHLTSYAVVINKSTVPVGTAQEVENIVADELEKRNVVIDFDVASNPEFLREGSAVSDSMYPDRVVVGTSSSRAEKLLADLYKPFVSDEKKILLMSRESSELTKYAANSMLATRISFMNQLARLADAVGADINDIEHGMKLDDRIGPLFLKAGVGYGGSCFPKDVKALDHIGKSHSVAMTLAREVDRINESQREWFAQSICSYFGPQISHKTIGVWGLAFKPDTDDIRYAPALDVIATLKEAGAKIVAYDPVAMDNVRGVFGEKIAYASHAQDVLSQVDALVVMTEWKEFVQTKPDAFMQLADKIVFDARNCLSSTHLEEIGITYRGIGRGGKLLGSTRLNHDMRETHAS